MWRCGLFFFLSLALARGQTQTTAYDALLVVGKQFNRAAIKRVISVTGVDGDPQPVEWTVLIADRNAPAGVRELKVAGGRIISNRTPGEGVAGTGAGATITTSQLNLDSSGAFTVASHTADRAHTNFDFVSYTLRTNERGTPVWIVTVQDQARTPLGTIHISAQRGNVTRVEGMYKGANMANVEQDPVVARTNRGEVIEDQPIEPENPEDGEIEEGDGDENVVKAEIKRMFRRTKQDATRLFSRVRRPFDDFFNRR